MEAKAHQNWVSESVALRTHFNTAFQCGFPFDRFYFPPNRSIFSKCHLLYTVHLNIGHYLYYYISMMVCLFVYLLIYLFIDLFIYLFIYLFI